MLEVIVCLVADKYENEETTRTPWLRLPGANYLEDQCSPYLPTVTSLELDNVLFTVVLALEGLV
jgi:hypothetical protein